jgi:choline dehydrogenase
MLRAQGITLRYDAPEVGRNLQDHAEVHMIYGASMRTLNQMNSWAWRALHGMRWLLQGRGAAAHPGADAIALLTTETGAETPDVLAYFGPYVGGLNDGRVELARSAGITLDVSVCRPQSRGYLELRSGDLRDPPAIHAKLLDSDADMARMLAGLRAIDKIVDTPPLSQLVTSRVDPKPAVLSDEQLINHARAVASPALHTAGTCRMGVNGASVVDPRLRVRGVENLRVIDASIVPSVPSYNLNAASMMIGARGAEFILEEAK